MTILTASPWEESESTCGCCGKTSRTFWGDVSAPEGPVAVYYVHYTVGSADHPPLIDVITGPWGEGTKPDERALVTMAYKPGPGGGLMIIDAKGRPADDRAVCGRALGREEVVGTPLAKHVFECVDAVFIDDRRIDAVVALGGAV